MRRKTTNFEKGPSQKHPSIGKRKLKIITVKLSKTPIMNLPSHITNCDDQMSDRRISHLGF